MRTREPPAIFQPSAITTYNPLKALQQKFINMAYKHPQLLIGEKYEGEKVDSVSDDQPMKTLDNFNHQNECRSTFTLKLFNGRNHSELTEKTSASNNCRLIGNVKPNLIKTWEQLNGTVSNQSGVMIPYPRENNEELDAQHEYINSNIYLSNNFILSDQTKSKTPQNNDSFVIRRPASQSGYFYDSIDNELVVTQDDEDQVISSLCDELENGGETMAEYISLIEKKEKLCWSIDSCN